MVSEQKKRLERGIIMTILGALLAYPIWMVVGSMFGRDDNAGAMALIFAVLPLAIGVYLLGRYFVIRQRSKSSDEVPVPEVQP